MKRTDFEIIIDIKSIWDSAVFVFDTNVLLDFYRIEKTNRDQLLGILKEIKKETKLWIPYQVGMEFYRNNEEIKKTNVEQFEDLKKLLEIDINSIKKHIQQNKEKTRNVDIHISPIEQILEKFQKELVNEIEKQSKNILDYDLLTKEIEDIFDNVGENYSYKETIEKQKEAKERVENKIPPGFDDKDKLDNKFGDVFVWFQTMDYAKANGNNVIFVTRDEKKDWFEKKDKMIVGPRKELLQEFFQVTGKQIYIYQPSQFAKEYIKWKGKNKTSKAINNPDTVQLVQALRDNENISFISETNFDTKQKIVNPPNIWERFNDLFATPSNEEIHEELNKTIYEDHINEMKEWFLDIYENPANNTPFDSHEGGYQYIDGPYDAKEELYKEFCNRYDENEINRAAEELETDNGTLEWSKK